MPVDNSSCVTCVSVFSSFVLFPFPNSHPCSSLPSFRFRLGDTLAHRSHGTHMIGYAMTAVSITTPDCTDSACQWTVPTSLGSDSSPLPSRQYVPHSLRPSLPQPTQSSTARTNEAINSNLDDSEGEEGPDDGPGMSDVTFAPEGRFPSLCCFLS